MGAKCIRSELKIKHDERRRPEGAQGRLKDKPGNPEERESISAESRYITVYSKKHALIQLEMLSQLELIIRVAPSWHFSHVTW